MDRIILRGVACRCHIGVPEKERRRGQTILVDLSLDVDLRRAGASDALADAPDYYALEKRIRAFAEASRFKMIERLAEALAQEALAFDRRIRSVTIVVRKKPAAMPRTQEVAVEITRRR